MKEKPVRAITRMHIGIVMKPRFWAKNLYVSHPCYCWSCRPQRANRSPEMSAETLQCCSSLPQSSSATLLSLLASKPSHVSQAASPAADLIHLLAVYSAFQVTLCPPLRLIS